MTKAEVEQFLKPFTDEIELRVWNGTVWARVKLEAKYSGRSGTTTVWVRPSHLGTSEVVSGGAAVKPNATTPEA